MSHSLDQQITRIGNYVLGLELGVASLGWAALSLDAEDKPCAILAMGARKFPVGTTGDIASGRDVSRNQRRQDAHSRRVSLARRIERLKKVWNLLLSAGFLDAPFKQRDAVIKAFDRGLDKHPYALRTAALDRALTPLELGRAIFHVAQRRGFQSNRRQAPRDDEELGVVKSGIAQLEKDMRAANARTLGEHLYKLHGPLRRRWTSRGMYRTEIDQILTVQRQHHPALTFKFCKHLFAALFDQRPLKSKTSAIGMCELEPAKRRMPLADPIAQEFRVLQRVNDLRLVDDVGAYPVELTAEQRGSLLDLLKAGDMTFAKIRASLKIPKTVRFNAERIDEKTLIGFRTDGRIRAILGSRTYSDDLVRALIDIDEEVGLKKRLTFLGFSTADVDALAALSLEPGYLSHSRKAVLALLPDMRSGMSYATAKKLHYPQSATHRVVRELPLVQDTFKRLNNPLVTRALGELRVVVNALVRKYGRPRAVRVSLMRELRLGRKSRERIHMQQRARQRERAAAAARLLTDMAVQDPPRWMVDKILLAEECGWVCPFTGKIISIRSLVGDAQFEVAHIVPLHQSLDDSFENKTLCHVSAIAEVKALRRRDAKTVARFEKLTGPFAKEKARRIGLDQQQIVKEYSEEVVAAHFVDSCYASKLAAEYVGLLFPPNSGDVTTTRGAITSYVREACGLNRIDLPRGSFKRHAIDATAVALSGPRIVRTLCAAALSAGPGRRRLSPDIAMPWPRYTDDVRRFVDELCVSVRVDRRASGPLHEETFYSGPRAREGEKTFHTTRKHLWQLTRTDLEQIEGASVREAVMKAVGDGDPRKVFANLDALPLFRGRKIRKVLVHRYEQAFAIGQGAAKRWVVNEENHHAAVFLTPKGKADRIIVSQFVAQRRKALKQPVVQFPSGVKPVMTLAVGETVTLDGKLMTVRSVSKDPRVSLVQVDDGRTLADIIASKELVRLNVEQLRMKGASKVVVGALGEVRTARD